MSIQKYFRILLLLSILGFIACEDKKDPIGGGGEGEGDKTINEWIYDEMSEKYFWYNHMPGARELDFTKESGSFFDGLLSSKDRFSYISYDGKVHEATSAGAEASHNDIGFEFQAFRSNNSENASIQLCVTYIKKGSEAETQGILKRGDWIIEIDDTPLTVKNFRGLIYSGKSTLKIKVGGKETFDLKATGVLYENPVYLSKMFQIGDKKIGYVVYNFFANGKSSGTLEYALEMNDIFKIFKNENINELILDLRYNPGGYVSSGTNIASAIVPNRKGKLYTQRKYNDILEKQLKYQNQKENKFVDVVRSEEKVSSEAIPELGMKRLYVITSMYTASASEQIINGLRGHGVTVEIVGERTVGKNMESFAIEDRFNKDNKWVLHPLTSVSYNGVVDSPEQNDYSDGFEPTIGWERYNDKGLWEYGVRNNEFQAYLYEGDQELYELGDERELLLRKALEHMTGKKIAFRMKRSLSAPVQATPFASSLERKRNDMIIKIKE